MKLPDLEKMNLQERRQFLKILGGVLALPVVPASVRDSVLDMVFGSKAMAQTTMPKNFIEINFRDQWDFGSLFVPPRVAQKYESIKSRIALFDAPIAERNGFYLTPQAEELRPHLDSIAVMEIGECVLPGNQSVHGHEAGNPLRSPGRTKNSGGGRIDMATVDKRPGGRSAGNEILYSSTPTPVILHNYYQKLQHPDLTNGVILRSSLRTGVHTYYHFEGNLANAQADRHFSRDTLMQAFSAPVVPPPQSVVQKHGSLISKIMGRVDANYMQRIVASSAQSEKHQSKTKSLEQLLVRDAEAPLSLALTSAERDYWTGNIPDQVVCPGDNAAQCRSASSNWHVGELFAYAFKLLRAGRVRSIGIDFDMHDIHTNRTPFVMDTQGAQSGRTLARLITQLKSAGLWDNTVIAMYTLDGSRSPISSSTGQDSKNAVVLAGGGIRGGYYGDIDVSTSGSVTYYRPDENGRPVADGATGRDGRVPAQDVYRTVATAAGIPSSVLDGFSDLRGGQLLRYMLR